MSEIPGASPSIEYERPQGVAFARTLRLLLLVTLVNTLLLGANLAGMKPWEFARQAYRDWSSQRSQAQAAALHLRQLRAAHQQCMAYTFAPDHVVYTEAPAEAMMLLAGGRAYAGVLNGEAPRGWQTPAIEKPLDCKRQFDKLRLPPLQVPQAQPGTLFLHERQSPQGKLALVRVALVARHNVEIQNVTDGSTGRMKRTYKLTKSRMLDAVAFAPPGEEPKLSSYQQLALITPDTEPRGTTVEVPGRYGRDSAEPPAASQPGDQILGNQFRFFGGQVDPSDPSHWTIAYELDGRAGVIDGWLKDDGIVLRPRTGRLLPSHGTPEWEMGR
ncbi:MAG: hypothetical protein ABIP55_16175 [Tepidisphaeraceae bacterium]